MLVNHPFAVEKRDKHNFAYWFQLTNFFLERRRRMVVPCGLLLLAWINVINPCFVADDSNHLVFCFPALLPSHICQKVTSFTHWNSLCLLRCLAQSHFSLFSKGTILYFNVFGTAYKKQTNFCGWTFTTLLPKDNTVTALLLTSDVDILKKWISVWYDTTFFRIYIDIEILYRYRDIISIFLKCL